ncbi:hypothetical protein [Streptomyces sp. NPDC006134]|uniref:hypothetical protein n=1 Tax=Streptomyces sp. NPDC006134 TaxID=3154467 RepID=UPI00340ABF42
MRRPLLLAAVATALLCAGCSTSDTGDDDEPAATSPSPVHHPAVRAAAAAVGKGTARIDQEIELTEGEERYVLTVTGGFDFAGDRGHMAVELPGNGVKRIEEIFAGDKVYVSGVQRTDEGVWGVIPRDEAEAHSALRAPLNDPEHVLRQISAMRQVTKEGEESVHGVRAVHYRGVLDHATLTLRMAQDAREKLEQARDLLGGDVLVVADAWVDGRGRLVQTRMSFHAADGGMTATMSLADFGEPVRVTVPKTEDTVPVTGISGVLVG